MWPSVMAPCCQPCTCGAAAACFAHTLLMIEATISTKSRRKTCLQSMHCDKERCRRHIAGSVVMNRDGGAGPVDEHLLAGSVVLPEHDILISAPSPVKFAKTAVAVAVRMRLAILLPQELQSDMFVGL